MSDDDLRSAFTDTGRWAEDRTRLAGPVQARRRSRRRSTATVAGAAALTVLALVGGTVAVAGLGGTGGSDVVPAAPAPTTTDAPSGVPTTIPDDLDLGPDVPADGDTQVRPVAGLAVDVCPGEGVPGVDAASDRRFTLATGPESAEGRGLLVFDSADGAVAFLSGLRSAAQRCAAGVPRPEGGTREIVAQPLPGAWAEGVTLLLLDVPDPGGDPQPIVGSFLLATRVGSAVALQFHSGEYLLTAVPAVPDPEVVAVERRPLDALAPGMCRWTVAGC